MNAFFRPSRLAALSLAALLFARPACHGDVTLPPIIGDNMVLQQNAQWNVWGKADPGERVTVSIGSQALTDTAGPDGKWAVKIDGLPPGGPYNMTILAKNHLTIYNVAVGEVWLCAGASNMAMTVASTLNAQAEIANADYPMLRVFTAGPNGGGEWLVCSPETVKQFSATAYYFGKELNAALRAPVGLIVSACDATPIQAWMPPKLLEQDFPEVMQRHQQLAAAYPAAKKAYDDKLAAYRAAGNSHGLLPVQIEPEDPNGPDAPGALYDSMIAPLTRLPIHGIAWYQGEADTGDAALYAKMFPALIRGWRQAWDTGDIPFIYVQIAGFLAPATEPGDSRWAELREVQAKTASAVPRTGMAVSIDTGAGIHPVDKKDVGHRLFLLANALAYGGDAGRAVGPVFAGMKVQGGKATITFQHAGEGLTKRDDRPLRGFAIAGDDRIFYWADAAIKGDRSVVLQSKNVPKPAAVRYAWADSPEANLSNKAGFQAAPFRTDTWDDREPAVAAQ